MKPKRIPQFELSWGEPEEFTLVPETAPDWDRIAKEEAERIKAREEMKKRNLILDL
jgi:hypothetical protein